MENTCSVDDFSKAEIDEQIHVSEYQLEYHARRIIDLKRRRNKITLIGRMNDHILLHIFTLLAHDPTRITDQWDWTILTHVCCHWRQIIMDDGRIWSTLNIRVESPSLREKVENHLSLSRHSDLTVKILQEKIDDENSVEHFRDILTIMAEHSARIKILRADIFGDTWNRISMYLKELFTHRLQEFDINLQNVEDPDPWHTENIYPDPQWLFFSNSLKRANLNHIMFLDRMAFRDFEPMIQNNLTDLTFKHSSFESSVLPDLLRSCPNLLQLTLEKCCTVNPRVGWEPPKLQLPYLRNLSLLYMDEEEISNFIKHLSIPANSNVTIQCCLGQNFRDDFSEHIDLNTLFLDSRCYESLEITLFSEKIGFDAIFRSSEVQHDGYTDFAKISLWFQWHSHPLTSNIVAKVNEVLRRNSLNSASKVQIRFDLAMTEAIMWLSLLELLNDTASLEIQFRHNTLETEENFMKSLRLRLPNALDSGRPVLCPSLEDLTIRFLTYTVECIQELQHSLIIRKAYNAPVKSLRILDLVNLADNDLPYFHDLSNYVQHCQWSRYNQ